MATNIKTELQSVVDKLTLVKTAHQIAVSDARKSGGRIACISEHITDALHAAQIALTEYTLTHK